MITLSVNNAYPFKVNALLIEELPFQFQVRDFRQVVKVNFRSRETVTYSLRPLSRGEFKVRLPYLLCIKSYRFSEKAV